MKRVFLPSVVALSLLLSANVAVGQIRRNTGLLPHNHAGPPVAVARLVKLVIKPESREEFLKAAQTLATLTRQEADCQEYHFYEDPAAPNTFLLVGEWASDVALARHQRQPYATLYTQQLPGWLASPAQITAYAVSKRTLTALLPAGR